MRRQLSLRARLLLGVIVLAAAGLVVADVVTYTSLRSFLIQRVDSSMDASHHSVERAVFGGLRGPGGPDGGLAPGTCVELRTLAGEVVSARCNTRFPGDETPSPPRLPATISLPAESNADDGDRIVRFDAPATEGDGRYRIRAAIEPQQPDYVLIIAAPLNDVDSTLHRLLLIELLVTALVLAGIAGLGLWVVRAGLRPLAAIGATAAAIADGDLSRRVERAEERTEVGRLGLALNAMLGQIESAFRAREASERKLRRFVADASHELRTPLAAVRAYAELFARGASERPADLARSMSGISRESERMSLLVDDLLLLARLDEGRPLQRGEVDLQTVVAEAVETAHAVEPARPIEIETDAAVVVGDRERLRQCIDNLLGNVRAHTPADTPMRVTLGRLDGSAEIVVADSGPGLTADQVEHVFERFYRADASRARASGGVGLGLAIVAAVVEAHGGTVAAESTLGEGAVFRIRLPLSENGKPRSAEAA
jgi:two-component system OmpR family sensor kinase